MNQALKNAIEELYRICDPDSSGTESLEGISIARERLNREFTDFISYLSASDGIISEYEAEFLAEYLGIRYTSRELRAYIDSNNTYSTAFEQKVPETLRLLAEQETDLHAGDSSDSRAYAEVFAAVAREFIVCDGEASEQEVSDMNTYLEMLNGYLRKVNPQLEQCSSSVDISTVHAGEVIPEFDEHGNRRKSLEELLQELNALIGLEAVKKDVNSLIHLQQIRKIRKQRGLKDIPVTNHLVFYGNPGTGKTTVARLLAQIYHAMGILSGGQFVEVDRSGLVAGYVGQTALKVQEVIKSALGGVLFIDEAYALTYSGSSFDYGQEAVDTLLKAMEDHREDFIVIVAGYPELMRQFIGSNPGLRSRFNKYIEFEDYSVEELLQILALMIHDAGYMITDEAFAFVRNVFEKRYREKPENFANAREVRNYFEDAVVRQADRLFVVEQPTDEELMTLTEEDFVDTFTMTGR